MSMKVFRELNAYGEPSGLQSMIVKIESALCDGWHRDCKAEARSRRFCSEAEVWFFFLRRAAAESPEIALAMTQEGCRLTIANIFPTETGEISLDQYNSILTEFYLKFLHPASSETGVTIEVSSDERGLEEAFGWRSVALLKRFSGCANKSSGHPADRSRWLDFIVSLHRRSIRGGDFGLLANWLIEEGWSEKKARELVSECDLALDLLRAIDRKGLLYQLEASRRASIE